MGLHRMQIHARGSKEKYNFFGHAVTWQLRISYLCLWNSRMLLKSELLFAKWCFSLTRGASQEGVRSCILHCLRAQWRISKRVPPSLLSTEQRNLAVSHCSNPESQRKDSQKYKQQEKRMLSGTTYTIQAKLCVNAKM